MDGGPQIMKIPASKPLSNVDINERGHYMDGTQMDPQSPGRDTHGTQRLPSLHFDGGLVSPTKAVDSVTSPLPSVGARDYRDLRIGLPMIADSASRSSEDDRRRRMPTRPRSFMPTPRTMDNDDLVKNFNPDPVPFHSQVFKDPLKKVRVCGNSMSASDDGTLSQGSSFCQNNNMSSHNRSSTMVKKFPAQSRHPAMWGATSDPENVNKPRGYIVHTDRYKWDEVYTTPDEFTQRGRLQLEMDYVNRLRSIRRRRELTPHRETVEFVMGGQKAELNERDDVMQELKNLKGLILPTAAKDLYVGKGFSKSLPKDHALNKPRQSLTYSQLMPFQTALDRARGNAPPANPNDSHRTNAEPPNEPHNAKSVPHQITNHVTKREDSDTKLVMEANSVPLAAHPADNPNIPGKENRKPPKLKPKALGAQ